MGHHEGKPGVPLTRPVTVIGSRSTARIHLISSTVSKAHALLVKSDGGIYIRDLASRSHVYVNGEEVREADLDDGDLIKIGSFTFKYLAGPVRKHGPGGAAPQAQLDVTGGEFPIPVDQRVMLIGRRSSDDVVLVEESVSTAHAVLFEMDGDRYVRDLGSRTGTFVNGVSTHQHKLTSGDVIRVGETDIKYTTVAAAAAPLEMAGESATGYALEGPPDEIQAAPGDEHGDTIGGLDLVGELVREEVENDRKPDRAARPARDEERLGWRRPARQAPEPIATPEEIEEPADEAALAPKDEVHQAQELEPLAPVAPVAPDDDVPAAPAASALEPLPLDDDDEQAVAAPAEGAAAPSADIEDLAAELLGEDARAGESLSGAAAETETTARASASPAEAAPESAPVPLAEQGTSPSPALDEAEELASRRRGWRGAPHEGEQRDEQRDERHERDERDDEEREFEAPLLPEQTDAVADEPAEVQASKDAESEVLRFPDTTQSTEADDDAAHEQVGAGDGAGTALLDQAALTPQAPADERAGEDFDFTDSLAAADAPAEAPAGLSAAGSDLKLDFHEPAAEAGASASPLAVEAVDLSGIDLGIKDEAPPAAPELNLDAPSAEDAAAALDFSVKEPPDAPPLVEAPPLKLPAFKLSEDAEALASATEALTKRQRDRKPADKPKRKGRGKKSLSEAVAEESAAEAPLAPAEPIEPFAFEEPAIDIPPIEQLEAGIEPMPVTEPPPVPMADEHGVEVLDETQPTPESALNLDRATDTVALDDDAIAEALAGESAAAADALSDTTFTRAVEDFAGDTVGDLVEPAATQAEPTEAPDDEPVVPRAEDKPRTPPGFDPFTVGANQENFLGGVPLPRAPLPRVPLHKPKPKAAPAEADPVDDLIAEIDTAAANAERARVESEGSDEDEQTGRAAGDVSASPFVPIPPAVPRLPRRPRPIHKRGVEMAPLPAHVDESIPPFKGADATSGSVTSAFDGLAMPPVRQADVFSQMSPPALAEPGAPADQAEDPRQASGIMTPMDLIGLRREPAPGAPAAASRGATEPVPAYKRRPRPTPGTYTVPDDFALGSGAVAKTSPEPITPPGFPSPTAPPGALEDPEEASPDVAVAADEDEDAPEARRRVVRPALPDPEAPIAQRRPPVIYADDIEIDAAAQRRRYLRRARLLTVAGLLLVVAAAVGTYLLVPVRSAVEANITYKNLAERTKRDRDEVQRKQLQQLAADHVRRGAIKNVLQTPEVSPGFLEDAERYARVVSDAGWRESNNVWTLVIPYEGTQREQDRVRVKALATALYEDNKSTLGRQFTEARSAVERLQESIKNSERRAQDVAGQIASLRELYEKRPSGEQVKSLEGELAKHENAWKKAVAAVKEAEADLSRLKAGNSAAAPADEARDPELANMQRALTDLQTKADRNRDQSTEEARKAREQLAGALDSFKKEITDANATVPGSPEMRGYIESAQKMFETTREVVAEMVRRQEQQFNSIMELKSRLNEKMEARRSDMWRADKELQDLTERLAILTRQYNAAVGGGLKNEAEELGAQVEQTQNQVKARQALIPVDPGYAEAIQQIELFIDTTKKNITEDRQRTDDLLARLQKSFTSGPQIDKLPADQQELAKRLEEKLSAINAARQQYNQSLDAGEQRATDEQLQQQIATLQAGIEARKKQILDQRASAGAAASAEAVKNKQAELDRLKAGQAKAEEAYFTASKDLDAARRAVADARSSFEKLEKLQAESDTLKTTMKTQSDTLLEKQRELKEAVYPEQPTDGDIRVREGEDRRVMFAAIAGGSLFLLFASLVSMASIQAARFGPGTATSGLAPADLRPIEHPRPQPTANGNGQPGALAAGDTRGDLPSSGTHGHDDDDDHAPAVI